jgi:hypothetical protein
VTKAKEFYQLPLSKKFTGGDPLLLWNVTTNRRNLSLAKL